VVKNERLIQAFKEMTPHYEAAVNNELQRFWGWSYLNFVDKLLDITPIHEHDIVLDVATGTAVIPMRLLEKTRIADFIVGLDITLDMLRNASKHIQEKAIPMPIELACADAMVMPFRRNAFDVIICGLATHHMVVPSLLSEMRRVLKPGGALTIADVGGSLHWQLPGVKTLIKIGTFFYFLITENIFRAWTEASALPNVYTSEEWQSSLGESGFTAIKVVELPKSHAWIPSPLLITARNLME
jgi:ubiquinone/menaquinone biosynthesis C-methylase UbiE